ncbi:MAG: ABC transporter ATP-binding protein [Candidatus Heimdallarchaeaceae archaeon]
MPEIRLHHVTKIFGKSVEAVKDLSFIIEDGEYISLIGPSGCGKTTTLRLLAGTILPTKGQIYFDDKSVENLSIQDRNIGFVFQHFAIFPHMTIWENVAYGPTVKGRKKNEIENLVESALKSVQLQDRAEYYPSSLSAPELQKTALARVIAAEARILLLDEPLGALDQKIREDFQFFLRNLVKREGLTAVHVTHDQSEALSISDRIAVMNRGELVQIGTQNDLIYAPTSIFTSFFVGESDFIDGFVLEDREKYATVKVGRSIIKVHNAGISKGDRVVISVRREFLDLIKLNEDPNKKKDERNSIKGKVVNDQFLGLYRRVQVRLENQQIVEAKIHAKNSIKFKHNDTVEVVINPSKTRCFKYPKEGIKAALQM